MCYSIGVAGGYLALLGPRARADAITWLEGAIFEDADSFDRPGFLGVYAGARRRFGTNPVAPTDAERHALAAEGLVAPVHWPLCDIARASLVMHALATLPAAQHVDLVDDLFYRGDNGEREAVLRALPMLPHAARFVPVAVEACRTNVESVFSAIALDNPFAAEHFTEDAYNQLVLKALFLDLDADRIFGLSDRTTPELKRMARDYADEREAAGRPLPGGIHRLLDGSNR